jgi:signal transduction histidine kinase
MKVVLVVDDKQIVQEAIRDWLEEEGFQTLGASGGKDGIELVKSHLPDLILCDVCMPDMSGYAVLEHLRKDPLTAAIPFIFLTVKGSKADMRYGMGLGADDYLTKPCTAKELLSAVNSRLAKKYQLQSQSQQQLDTLRSSLTLSLPHEFRTPLTGIMTGVELLRVIANNPEEILEVADSIEECTDRLYTLVKKFLLYAELEIVARDPNCIKLLQTSDLWEPVDVIATIAAKMAVQCRRQADLQLNLHPVQLQIPEERLSKVIEELLDNAFKFSEPGTAVQICGISEPVMPDAEYYSISISNQGQGLTPEQIKAIGAYVQFNRRYYEQQGSGLGLSIARRITELYSGKLIITSAEGITTVKVLLPAGEEPES